MGGGDRVLQLPFAHGIEPRLFQSIEAWLSRRLQKENLKNTIENCCTSKKGLIHKRVNQTASTLYQYKRSKAIGHSIEELAEITAGDSSADTADLW